MLGVRVWGFLLPLCCICFVLHVAAQSTDPTEVSALRSVKRRLVDPLKHLNSWNKGDPCASNWAGVHCNYAVGADGYMHVQELHLLNMNLSGTIAPEVGKLSHLEILDFMWNQITGRIPMEIGNLSSLRLLLLNGNTLSGSLPEELGLLPNLNRLQVDENFISGPIPVSFANMRNVRHLHLNNNSISGQLPPELSKLPKLLHLLVDNNNLSGYLPPEYSALEELEILQVDNNPSMVAKIPASYGNMSRLVKLSLRNCSLSGSIPDLSRITNLTFTDLSWNQLTGPIPSNKLSDNITTIFLSYNHLKGLIPESLSDLPSLQTLSLENNSLSGPIAASLWNKSRNASATLIVDLRNNMLSNVSGDLNLPENVTLRLRGNPVCNANIQGIHRFCDSDSGGNGTSDGSSNPMSSCPAQACPLDQYFEYLPTVPDACFCAAPVKVGYRLKSPSFTVFPPFKYAFEAYITHSLNIDIYQLVIDSFAWEEGPRLRMYLKLFPPIGVNHTFNISELDRIKHIYMSWHFPGSEFFGPYELLNFTLLGPYASDDLGTGNGHISKGALAGILVGAILGAVTVSAVVTLLIVRRNKRYQRMLSKTQLSSRISIKIDGVKDFTFKEMAQATDNFKSSSQVGQGGYGKVYKGILSDKSVVAIKRAEEGSLQGKREFLTEIQLLSRVHHRNLVSLVGYCGEAGEQMLVYEFMSNHTLRDWLAGKFGRTLNFGTRLRIALGSAKGVLYLHTEANPPIFHRDIKTSNILLDSNMVAKVADFGLSRLAPVLDNEGNVPHHVSTIVKGTPGYLDPEYFLTHKLTDKSDVYSLGVVFLELLTGIPPISHGKNLVREVNMASQSGSILSIIDSNMGAYPAECMERFAALALGCCEDKPENRPSMLEIVRELENILQMMPPESGTLSEFTSTHSRSSSSPTSSMSNVGRYARMSSEISGSDLTSSTMPNIVPR